MIRTVKQPRGRVDVFTLKRLVLVIAAVALPAVVAAVVFVRGGVPGTNGCVLRSVDKKKYVAGNEAVFRTLRLPQWLRKARANTWVQGVSAQNSCLPREDSGDPPFAGYVTTYVFIQKPGGPPIGFDERILRGQWVRQPNTGAFRHGLAWLNVETTTDSVLLSIDYRAFARLRH